MKKTRFSENLFAKMMLFSIIAFLLIFLSGQNQFEFVSSAPRVTDNYEQVVDYEDEEDGLIDEGEAEMEEPELAVEPEKEEVEWPERVAFLTFDDGPSRHTLDLLAILAELDVPAMFFVIGQHITDNLTANEAILQQILADGHYVGLHSMTHSYQNLYDGDEAPARFVAEMVANQALIYELTGHFTNLCRAPFGMRASFSPEHFEEVAAADINCVDWNVDPRDWFYRDSQIIYQNIREQVSGSDFPSEIIIVLHEYSWTLEALPDIITFLRDNDYVFKIYTPGFEFNY